MWVTQAKEDIITMRKCVCLQGECLDKRLRLLIDVPVLHCLLSPDILKYLPDWVEGGTEAPDVCQKKRKIISTFKHQTLDIYMMIMIILPGQILRCDDGGPLQPGPGRCQLQGSGGPAPRPGELPLVLSGSRDLNTHLCQVGCDWLITQYSPLIGW